MSRTGDFGAVKKRSGWLIPLVAFVVTAMLSVLVFLYYFAPTPPELVEEQIAPTDSTSLVEMSLAGIKFHIPANFLPYPSQRRGGTLTDIELMALLPDLEGYSLSRAEAFADNGAESQIIRLSIRPSPDLMTEQERFIRLYAYQVTNPEGVPNENGLIQYTFKPDAGYSDEELFSGYTNSGIMLMRCSKPSPDLPEPSCLRTIALTDRLSLSYRIRRSQLTQWREIDSDVRALIGAFMDRT